MSTKRFDLDQAKQSDKLNQHFSFTGKVHGTDVLLRLVEACGYEVVHGALEKLRPPLPTLKPSASAAVAGKRKSKKVTTASK